MGVQEEQAKLVDFVVPISHEVEEHLEFWCRCKLKLKLVIKRIHAFQR